MEYLFYAIESMGILGHTMFAVVFCLKICEDIRFFFLYLYVFTIEKATLCVTWNGGMAVHWHAKWNAK